MQLKYKVETKSFSYLKERIEIPRFQRGLRWRPEKRKGFIKTLKAGLPVGSLLLYPKEQNENKYLVVDGLQRFSTMLEYAREPFKYIEPEELTDSDLMTIILSSKDAKYVYDNYQHNAQQAVFSEIRIMLF